MPNPLLPVIFERPSNPKYRTSDLPNTQPALIFKDGDFTYLCWLYGSMTKPNWKICRIQTVFNNFQRLNYDPVHDSYLPFTLDATGGTTAFLYPFGCGGYNFHPSQVSQYDFDFLR